MKLLLLFLLIVIPVFSENYINVDSIKYKTIGEYRKSIHPKYKELTFKLAGTRKKSELAVTNIFVYVTGEKLPFQILDVEESISKNNDPGFYLEDLNFDGYLDIRLKAYVTNQKEYFEHFWLFNPQKNIFEYNWEMSALVSPKFDKNKKRVIVEQSSGSFYKKEIYKFSGKTLVKHSEEKGEPAYKAIFQYRSTIKKWKNNEMVSLTEKHFTLKGKEKILLRQVKNVYYPTGETKIVIKQRQPDGEMIVHREYKR